MREPRQTLEEMILAVEVRNTSLLLVEGPTDRDFYAWLMADFPRGVEINTAADVEIDDSVLHGMSLTVGNRGRLIALALQMPAEDKLRCAIDRDCGQEIPALTPATLLITDFPAIESYAFSRRVMGKWLLTVGRELNATVEVDDLLSELTRPLIELFHLRCYAPNMSNVGIASYFRADEQQIWRLDGEKLAADKGISNTDYAQAMTDAATMIGQDDARPYVYGHDIARFLERRYANAIKNKVKLRDIETLERTLRNSLERADLLGEPFFEELTGWVRDQGAAGAA